MLKHWRWWRRRGRLWSRRELCTIVLQTRSVRAEDTQYLCTNALSHALTEQLKRDLHDTSSILVKALSFSVNIG